MITQVLLFIYRVLVFRDKLVLNVDNLEMREKYSVYCIG